MTPRAFTSLLSVALAVVSFQDVAARPSKRSFSVNYERRTSDLQISENIVPLQKRVGAMSPSSHALWATRNRAVGLATTIPVGEGATYDAQIQLGDQCFNLIWDTGSSDLWVPLNTFQCFTVDNNGQHIPTTQSACGFGNLYSGTFSEGAIADQNLNVDYGFGGFVTGTLGYEHVSFGGISIDRQEMALINKAHWEGGYGVCSGVFGFAFPHLTGGFSGNDPARDTNATAVHYEPWIFNAIAKKKIAPLFSLALERGSNGGHGHIALGGLPDVKFIPDFASTPIQDRAITFQSQNTTKFTYYTITPDGYTANGTHVSTDFPFIVDSGSTFVYLPNEMAKHINELFNPPAQYAEAQKAWEVDCDAEPPRFGITIGEKTFYINSKDMLVRNAVNQTPPTGKCLTGVQPSGSSPAFLGDVFLKSVVAVFDIGAGEMHLAAHEYS